MVGATVYTHYDYETWPNVNYDYRLTVYEQTLDDVVASPSHTLTNRKVTSKKVWLKNPLVPAQNIQFPVEETVLSRSRPKARTVHKPIGREDAIVVRGVSKVETFGITFVILTDARYLSINTILETEQTLLLQTAQTQWYVDVMDITIQEYLFSDLRNEPDGRAWKFTVTFQESTAP
jgi:hypothetical protein